MKKIFLFILVVMFFITLNFKIFASEDLAFTYDEKDIVAEIGSANNTDLFTEGIKEVSASVDWEKEGDYKVLCTKENGEIFERNVYVRDKDSLEKGIDIFNDLGSLDFEINNISKILDYNILPLNIKEYYAYYNCLMKNGVKTSFVIKYKKNEASILYQFDGKSYVADMCLYDGFLHVLLNVYEGDLVKTQIAKFDLNLNQVNNHRFNSNASDEGKYLYFYNNELYVLMNTSSNDGFIRRGQSNKVILILRINPLNYSIAESLCIGNSYDNKLILSNFDEGNMTMLLKLDGSNGDYYHSINKNYSGYFIVNINKNMEANILKCLENECENYYEIDFDTNNLLLIWKENDRKIGLKWGEYRHEINVSIDEFNGEITSIASEINKDTANIFISINNKLTNIISLNVSNVINKGIDSINYNCIEVKAINEMIFLKMEGNEKRLFSYEKLRLSTFEEELLKEDLNIKYENKKLFINELEVKSEGFIPNFSDKFGKHYISNKLSSEKYLIVYKSNYDVPLLVNVSEGETYDPGLVLNFNGKAKLNNKLIENNFILNNIGKYQLEIYAENGDLAMINFEIIDKCIDEINLDNESNIILEYMGYEISQNKTLIYEVIIDEEGTYYNNSNDLLISLIVFLIFVYIGLLFIFRKYKRKGVKE